MTRDPVSPAERAADRRAKADALDLNPIVDVYESDPYRGGGAAASERLAAIVERYGWDVAKRLPEVARVLAWFEQRP